MCVYKMIVKPHVIIFPCFNLANQKSRSCLGYGLAWLRVVLCKGCLRGCTEYNLSRVRVVLVFGYELSIPPRRSRCILRVDSDQRLRMCLAGSGNEKMGISEWSITSWCVSDDSTSLSCLHLVQQQLESRCQHIKLHSCVTTSCGGILMTVSSQWSVLMLGLIDSTTALKLQRPHFCTSTTATNLAYDYNWCRGWQTPVFWTHAP